MPTNDPNHPDPNGPKPAGVSDSAWYGYTKVDSTKPLSAWNDWDQYVDKSATGYERYKSRKLDFAGNPIEGLFEHPDACPPGMTAFGIDKCYPVESPQVQSAWNTPVPGQAPPGPTAAPTPPPPPPQWDDKGNFNSGGVGTANASAVPGSLQDKLQTMFATRAGNLFGTPGQGGTFGVNNDGMSMPQTPQTNNAKALSGGGLMWSQDDLNSGPTQAPAAAQPAPGSGGGQPQPQQPAQAALIGALTQPKMAQATAPSGPPASYTGPAQGANSAGQYWQSQQWPQQPTTAGNQLQQALSTKKIQTAGMPNRNNPNSLYAS